MNFIINGMGCPVSGGRLVLEQLVINLPKEDFAIVIIPFKPDQRLYSDNIKFIYLPHKFWGKYLRPLIDVYLNLKLLFNKNLFLVNLSNYGLLFFKRSILYFHNPLLLDLNEKKGFGDGKSNFLVKYALHQSLVKSKLILVQTDHVRDLLEKYLRHHSLVLNGLIEVVKPKHVLSSKNNFHKHSGKFEEFKLFYPARDFPHKNIALAAETVKKIGKNVTLFLTTDKVSKEKNVTFLGKVSYDQILKNYNSSDALLFTSERETLGLPLLEALEYQKPAILPDLEYAREIFEDSGVYFKEFTIDSIVKSIDYLIENYEFVQTKVKSQKEKSLKFRKDWRQHWELITSILMNDGKNNL